MLKKQMKYIFHYILLSKNTLNIAIKTKMNIGIPEKWALENRNASKIGLWKTISPISLVLVLK